MSIKEHNILIVIVGPTAVGKTELTIEMAKAFRSPVLNADSRQVYKELNIGTAKPSKEDMQGVKHYFVGDRDLITKFSAGMFEREALDLLSKIYTNSSLAILSGGSGLYIKAVCDGLDIMPEINPGIRKELNAEVNNGRINELLKELEFHDPDYWSIVDTGNTQRIVRALEVIRTTGQTYTSFRINSPGERSFSTIKIGLDLPRSELYLRINDRVDAMIESGLVDEVRSLVKFRENQALQTVGYQEIFGYLDGSYDLNEAVRLLKRNTRRYAKRQLTWFRNDPEIQWFQPDKFESIVDFIKSQMQD